VTPTVFGDLLDAASEHLEAAITADDHRLADPPAVVPPLHRLVTILSHYIDDLTPCDEIEAVARTDLHVWERVIIDTGSALHIAADCLNRSGAGADPDPGDPVTQLPPSQARHISDAAAALAAGRDLLYTHIVLDPDGLVQDRSEWAPVVTSLSVTHALANEIAIWSARLAPFTAWLAGSATSPKLGRLADQPSAWSRRGELLSASRWLRTAGAALRPVLDVYPVRAADVELLYAIPAAVPPPRQPPGSDSESIAELCHGITISASRLRAAVHRGRDQTGWSPDATSGRWQWIAQAAAVTSHLTELALRSLATRTDHLTSLPVTRAQLHGAADAMIAMRTAWQRVDLMWTTIITEQRVPRTPAMAEASDLLLRMGRLVWDNPQWTPARAARAARRDPAALAPGTATFAEVVSAAHQAADALARVAITDTTTVEAAAWSGRLYVPTRSLPARYDIPRAFTPAPPAMVVELQQAYRDAADASIQATRELDELAITAAAPSRALALARTAAPAQSRRRGGYGPPPDDGSHDDAPLTDVLFNQGLATGGLPGPVERAVRDRRVYDPVILLRAAATDNAARHLIGLADNAAAPAEAGGQDSAVSARHARDAVQLAAQSFPHDPLTKDSGNTSCRSGGRSGGAPSTRTRPRKN
jgi:hypothetical protein